MGTPKALAYKLVFGFCMCYLHAHLGFSQCPNFEASDLKGENSSYKSRGNRCEGYYGENVINPRFVLSNFTVGRLKYNLKDDEVITIYNTMQPAGMLNVTATSLIFQEYYRMDARVANGDKLKWPVKDVLLPNDLGELDIALFGHYQATNADTLWHLPVRFETTSKKNTIIPGVPLLVVSAVSDAKSVSYTIFSVRRNGEVKKVLGGSPGLVREGSAFEIKLNGLTPGKYLIWITSLDRADENSKTPDTIKFFLKI